MESIIQQLPFLLGPQEIKGGEGLFKGEEVLSIGGEAFKTILEKKSLIGEESDLSNVLMAMGGAITPQIQAPPQIQGLPQFQATIDLLKLPDSPPDLVAADLSRWAQEGTDLPLLAEGVPLQDALEEEDTLPTEAHKPGLFSSGSLKAAVVEEALSHLAPGKTAAPPVPEVDPVPSPLVGPSERVDPSSLLPETDSKAQLPAPEVPSTSTPPSEGARIELGGHLPEMAVRTRQLSGREKADLKDPTVELKDRFSRIAVNLKGLSGEEKAGLKDLKIRFEDRLSEMLMNMKEPPSREEAGPEPKEGRQAPPAKSPNSPEITATDRTQVSRRNPVETSSDSGRSMDFTSDEGEGSGGAVVEKREPGVASESVAPHREVSWSSGRAATSREVPSVPAEKTATTYESHLTEMEKFRIDQQVGSRLVLSIRNHEEKARFTLEPPQLGSISIEISREKEAIKATLWADNPATKELLEGSRFQLQKILGADGFRLEGFDVFLQQHGGGPFHGRERSLTQTHPWPETGEGSSDPSSSSESIPNPAHDPLGGSRYVDRFV